MRSPLTAHTIALGAVVAVLVAAAFVVVASSAREARRSSDAAQRAQTVTVSAVALGELTNRLDATLRGYVLGNEPRFFTPFDAARGALPPARRALSRTVTGGDERTALTAAGRDLDSYLKDFAPRAIRAARTEPSPAVEAALDDESTARLRTLDRDLGRLVAVARARAAAQSRRAHDDAGRTITVGLVAAGAALLVIALWALYETRSIVLPLRRLAAAARRMGRGELDARVPPTGRGEAREVAEAFNAMAAALERRSAELSAEQRVKTAVLDATPDAIGLFDAEGAAVVENAPMRALRERHGDAALAGARGSPGAEAELRDELAPPGSDRAFLRYAAPVHDAGGTAIGRLVVLRDVTAERESERMKDEFFALVSHELRTPLTAIIGHVELLLADAPPSGDDHRSLEVVGRNAARLLRLVGDLLFVAQVQAGAPSVVLGDVDLAGIAREAVDAARPAADEAGVTLNLRAESVPPGRGDRDRLAQAMDNLLSNAIKFTPAGGGVEVRLRAEGERALLEVADTGIGIPAGEEGRLFERFFRASSATERAIPGIGLGLTIVEAIVKGHGGRISVASPPDGGATFSVELPLRPPAPAAAPAAPRAGRRPAREEVDARSGRERDQFLLDQMPVHAVTVTRTRCRREGSWYESGMTHARVLVAEDDADVRELVCTILRRAGHDASEARDGQEALRALYDVRPDLVILDVAMPELDGFGALERIRDLSDVPVLMLTARDTEMDKVRGLRGGADDYVTKPFGRAELLARVDALLRRTAGRAEAPEGYADGLLRVDFAQRTVEAEGQELRLTPQEFRLLAAFVRHPGQVLSHEQLLEIVWGDAYATARDQVKLYVGYLRRKLRAATDAEPIETVRGFGYRYRPPS